MLVMFDTVQRLQLHDLVVKENTITDVFLFVIIIILNYNNFKDYVVKILNI